MQILTFHSNCMVCKLCNRSTVAPLNVPPIEEIGTARELLSGRALSFDDPQTFAIIGAGFDVHKELGCGFLEGIYRAAFAIELRRRGVPFRQEVRLPVWYKGELLPLQYRVDFICFDEIIVEVKALGDLGPIEHAQAINYLRVAGLNRALLLNFGARSLQHRRIVVDLPPSKDPRPPRRE